MQNESWMQPALQTSEAVLLPALEPRPSSAYRFGSRLLPPASSASDFRPVSESWEQPSVSRTVATRQGSMAGRSVLRAAGVRCTPVSRRPFKRT